MNTSGTRGLVVLAFLLLVASIGLPAHAQTGACCRSDGICNVTDESTCTSLGRDYMGDSTPCTSTLCRGACCRADGECLSNVSKLSCEFFGRTYMGHGSLCSEQECPVLEHYGACCRENSCQEIITPEACVDTGGVSAGDLSTCIDCPGACCLPDDSCLDSTRADCLDFEGAQFRGNLTQCPLDGCGAGACCLPSTDPAGRCEQMDAFECDKEDGQFRGAGSTCEEAECAPFGGACCSFTSCQLTSAERCAHSFSFPTHIEGVECGAGGSCPGEGACCGDGGECELRDGVSCVDEGGQHQGEGTSCSPNPCPPPRGACCHPSTRECVDDVDPDLCEEVLVGLYQGHGTTCDGTPCGEDPPPPDPAPPARLTIEKVARPFDLDDTSALFRFVSDSPEMGTFTLRPEEPVGIPAEALSASRTVELPSGRHEVREEAPPGWDLKGITCDPPALVIVDLVLIDLEPGTEARCVFRNEQVAIRIGEIGDDDPYAEITVIKEADPADGMPVEFRLGDATDAAAAPPLATLTLVGAEVGGERDAASTVRFVVPPGAYAISELVPPGWALDTRCTPAIQGTRPDGVVVGLEDGDSVTCTFTNTKLASLEVCKSARPLDPNDTSTVFPFTSPEVGEFTLHPVELELDPLGGASFLACTGFTVFPGPLDVEELVPPGWKAVSVGCTSNVRDPVFHLDQSSVELTVDPGEEVRCTFVNQQFAVLIGGPPPGTELGEIVVVKDAAPADGTAFDFTISPALGGAPPVAFTLSDTDPGAGPAGGNTARFVAAPGSYVIAETLPEGWGLREIDCRPLRTVDQGVLPPNAQLVELRAGEIVTCTFRNERPAKLKVIKDALPLAAGDTSTTFRFTSPQLGDFELQPDVGFLVTPPLFRAETDFEVPAGVYEITEHVPPGWVFDGASCRGGAEPVVVGPLSPQVLPAPEPVTLQVRIEPGAQVICDFVNLQLAAPIGEPPPDDFGQIIVVKDAAPADGTTFGFAIAPALGGALPVSFFLRDSDPGAEQSSDNTARFVAAPGGYVITEELPEGWGLREIECLPLRTIDEGVLPPDSEQIELRAGETVTCTFRNERPATLEIVKVAVPLDASDTSASFAFSSPQLGSFSLQPDQPFPPGRLEARRVFEVFSGEYTVGEQAPPPGWALFGFECSDGRVGLVEDSVTVELSAGDYVGCAFVNIQLATPIGEPPADDFGQIVVIKDAVPADGTAFDLGIEATDGSAAVSFALADSDPADGLSNGNHARFVAAPGLYQVFEEVPSGWELDGIDCGPFSVSREPFINIEVRAGETVTCTVRNEKLGTLIVEKRALPLPGEAVPPFAFTHADETFSVQPSSPLFDGGVAGSRAFPVSAGAHEVAEQLTPGWSLKSIACTSDRSGPTGARDGKSISVDIAPGETVTCVFTNEQVARPIGELGLGDPHGDILVVKQAVPAGDTAFEFTFSAAGGTVATFDLRDGDSDGSSLSPGNHALFVAAPGAYSLREAVPEGWRLREIVCSPPGELFPPNVVDVEVVAGARVTCTFTNARTGRLVFLDVAEQEVDELALVDLDRTRVSRLCGLAKAIEEARMPHPRLLEKIDELLPPSLRYRLAGRDLAPEQLVARSATLRSFGTSGDPIAQAQARLEPSGDELRQRTQLVLVPPQPPRPDRPRARRPSARKPPCDRLPAQMAGIVLLAAERGGRVVATAEDLSDALAEVTEPTAPR